MRQIMKNTFLLKNVKFTMKTENVSTLCNLTNIEWKSFFTVRKEFLDKLDKLLLLHWFWNLLIQLLTNLQVNLKENKRISLNIPGFKEVWKYCDMFSLFTWEGGRTTNWKLFFKRKRIHLERTNLSLLNGCRYFWYFFRFCFNSNSEMTSDLSSILEFLVFMVNGTWNLSNDLKKLLSFFFSLVWTFNAEIEFLKIFIMNQWKIFKLNSNYLIENHSNNRE
jgi:hypothetical protein